ncbi:hypothetical protein BDN72DRAFT_808825 [Pluteus cervinus]|uniref:Uncharacterized protein n=1 Tax=Pluteus cervinus TaxID=181527 RepID=A0ACD3BH56_9AGAR|nr:hypothetical protein BDN72DRAFT_808825 [Pluteus cervinus]
MLNATTTSPHHWRYVSEGGASIVFSYRGPPNIGFNGTVLRLRKVPRAPKDGHSKTPIVVEDEPDDPIIEYQQRCMEKLIPIEHLPRLESVLLDKAWLEEVSDVHDAFRPESRTKHDCIDVTRKKGVLATDLVGTSGIAVELKPKWGFMPSATHLSEATRSIKTQTCRFCMHSRLKSHSGQQVASGYCPMDLFSGDESRITKAIHDLWDAWYLSEGTVNNLKVFVKGTVVRPSEAARMLDQGYDSEQSIDVLRDIFTAALLPLLKDTPVLHLLSKFQRTLDPLDIEGLSKLWSSTQATAATRFVNQNRSNSESPNASELAPSSPIGVATEYFEVPEPTVDEWCNFIDTYLVQHPAMDHINPSPDNLRYYLLAYLLSATFKDCSVMLRLDLLRPGAENVSGEADRVKVIDLDPKSISRLRKWEKTDQEIHLFNADQEPLGCIDQHAARNYLV